MHGEERPPNAVDLLGVPVGTASDGLTHGMRVTAPLPGETYTGTDDADAFPPRQRELYGNNWPGNLQWPFALSITETDTEPHVRCINTLVPLCWELRETSYRVHLVAHDVATHVRSHPHGFDLTSDVHRHRAKLSKRHDLDSHARSLKQYHSAFNSLAHTTRVADAREVCAWVEGCLDAIDDVQAAYDSVFEYSGDTVLAVDDSEHHVTALQDAFDAYDDVLYDIDLVSVVTSLYKPLRSGTSTGYV